MALSKKEELLKEANVAKTIQETARSEFELQQAKELKDQVVLKATLENQQTGQNITLQRQRWKMELRDEERRQLANTANVEHTIQSILESKMRTAIMQNKAPHEIEQLKVMIQNAKEQGLITKMDRELREQGINPHDPIYWRIIAKNLSQESWQRTSDNIFEMQKRFQPWLD